MGTTVLVGCNGVEPRVVEAVANPDATVTAVLIQYGGGGATVGFTYSGHIVREGEPPTEDNIIFRAERLRGRGIWFRWLNPDLLEVNYDSALIGSFRNSWWNGKVGSESRRIEVRLIPHGDSTSFRP